MLIFGKGKPSRNSGNNFNKYYTLTNDAYQVSSYVPGQIDQNINTKLWKYNAQLISKKKTVKEILEGGHQSSVFFEARR